MQRGRISHRKPALLEELPERLFTFLNTSFGHFMFAQFHRSLAKYSDKLGQLDGCSWLIDSRGESTSYLNTCIDLYMNLDSYASDDISNKIHHLMSESKKPQKPGFFLSNNTDYDWRDESKTNHKQNPKQSLWLRGVQGVWGQWQ